MMMQAFDEMIYRFPFTPPTSPWTGRYILPSEDTACGEPLDAVASGKTRRFNGGAPPAPLAVQQSLRPRRCHTGSATAQHAFKVSKERCRKGKAIPWVCDSLGSESTPGFFRVEGVSRNPSAVWLACFPEVRRRVRTRGWSLWLASRVFSNSSD